MRPLEGLLTAMVTPFRPDGSVNEDGAVAGTAAAARDGVVERLLVRRRRACQIRNHLPLRLRSARAPEA